MRDLSDGGASSSRTPEELLANSEYLRPALAALEVGMALIDASADAVWLDAVAQRLLGVSADGPVTMDTALLNVVDDDRRELARRREAALVDATIERYEADVRMLQPDGEVRWLRMLGHPHRDGQGRVIRIDGLLRDVSEYSRAMIGLRQADERHAFLLEVSDALRQLRDPVEIGRTFVALLGHQLHVDSVHYTRVDEAGGWLVVENAYTAGNDSVSTGTRVEIYWPTLQLVRDGDIVAIDDVTTDERLDAQSRARILAIQARSLLVAPLIHDGAVVRLLSVAASTPRRWSHHELTLVAEVVERLWSAEGHATVDRDNEARLASIIETAADCIIVTDGNGIIRLANRATTDTFGYLPDEVVGRNVAVLMGGGDAANHDGHLARYRNTGEAAIIGVGREVEGRRRDGSTVPLELAVTEWWDSHGERYFTGTLRDITQRRQQTEALARARKLEVAGQLAGGVAHDLNNLLTVIGGNLELAEERIDDDATRTLISRALEVVRRGVTFNDRLLSLVHDRHANVQPLLVTQRLDEIGSMLQHLLGPGMELMLDVAPDLWAVSVDPGELDSALMNLATNGRDAMASGGRLTVRAHNRFLHTSDLPDPSAPVGDYVVLSVTDTGCGMSADAAKRATDPFFTTKAAGHGTGLGLASVAGFVHGSSGFIGIDTAPSQGTTVTLYLPRSIEPVVVAAPPAPDTAPSRVQRILVVDDDDLVRETTAATVESLGYKVSTANDGTDAVSRLERDHNIDAVLTDVVMPRMDGRELALWIEANRPGVGVVLCSGYHAKWPPDPGGAPATFLVKPYTRSQLGQTLAAVLSVATAPGAQSI